MLFYCISLKMIFNAINNTIMMRFSCDSFNKYYVKNKHTKLLLASHLKPPHADFNQTLFFNSKL